VSCVTVVYVYVLLCSYLCFKYLTITSSVCVFEPPDVLSFLDFLFPAVYLFACVCVAVCQCLDVRLPVCE